MNVTGRYSYRQNKVEVGSEEWQMTRTPSGRLYECAVTIEDEGLSRMDIKLDVDVAYKPVRLEMEGRFAQGVGTAQYDFADGSVRGRIERGEKIQTVQKAAPGPFVVVPHPIACYDLLYWSFNFAKHSQQQRLVFWIDITNPTSFLTGDFYRFRLKVGEWKDLRVPAGTFRCRHFVVVHDTEDDVAEQHGWFDRRGIPVLFSIPAANWVAVLETLSHHNRG